LEAIKRHLGEGGSIASAARELGCKPGTLSEWTRSSLGVNNSRDLAVQTAMDAVRTGLVPHSMWTKVPPKDGEPGFSVYHKIEQPPEDVAERIRVALEGLTPAEPVIAPESVMANQITAYLLSDRHTGMMAWARETGEAYNTELACRRVKDWVSRCVAASPASHTALILDNGDGQHADDQTNQTPRSKHGLDVDTRYFRTIEADVEALGTAIELAKAKHTRVIVRIMAGNHNPHSWIALLVGLAERYRQDPRVEVIRDPSEFFVMEWGKVLIAAHHGDKARPDRLVHFIADEFAEMWGRTRHRYLFTGHLHSHKSQDIGGVTWEQLRAVTARDAYAYSNAYVGRAQMQAITYDRDLGEVQRVKVGA
jgi:hypothetical protein